MKQWYTSKTVWLNLITFTIGVLALVVDSVPPEWAKYIIMLSGVLNVALRVFFTDAAIKR